MTDYETRQLRLIASLEGIGDVLVVETERLKERRVREGLARLARLIEHLFSLEGVNPEKFGRLMVSPEYWNAKQSDSTAALLQAAFGTSNYLITFSTAIGQVNRVMTAAIERDYGPIVVEAVNTVLIITKLLTVRPQCKSFLEETMKQLNAVLQLPAERPNSTAHDCVILWYQICVLLNKDIRWEYLDLLNGRLYSQLQLVIRQDNLGLFRSWLGTLNVGLNSNWPHWLLGNYVSELFGNRKATESQFATAIEQQTLKERASDLDMRMYSVIENGDIQGWVEAFREYVALVRPLVGNDLEEQFNRLNRQILTGAENYHKHQRLLEIFVGLAVFALAEEKWHFVAEIWFHNQPQGSLMVSTAPKLIPDDLATLMRLWFLKGQLEKPFGFMFNFPMNLHDSEREYFLLLLAHLIKTNQASLEGALDLISKPVRLRDVIRILDSYTGLSEQLSHNTELLEVLGFSSNGSVFTSSVPSLLSALSNAAKQKLNDYIRKRPLDPITAQRFLDELRRARDVQVGWLRNIFLQLQLYGSQETGNPLREENFITLSETVPRQIFLDNWDEDYLSFYTNWGFQIGQVEEERILTAIADQCAATNVSRAMELAATDLLWFLVISERGFLELTDRGTLVPVNTISEFCKRLTRADTKHWPPCCNFGGQTLPVFIFGSEKFDEEVFLLNGLRLGYLEDFVIPARPSELSLRSGPFLLEANSWSKKKEHKIDILRSEGLDEATEAGQRRLQELDGMVDMLVRECFQFSPHRDFQGYRFPLAATETGPLAGR